MEVSMVVEAPELFRYRIFQPRSSFFRATSGVRRNTFVISAFYESLNKMIIYDKIYLWLKV